MQASDVNLESIFFLSACFVVVASQTMASRVFVKGRHNWGFAGLRGDRFHVSTVANTIGTVLYAARTAYIRSTATVQSYPLGDVSLKNSIQGNRQGFSVHGCGRSLIP